MFEGAIKASATGACGPVPKAVAAPQERHRISEMCRTEVSLQSATCGGLVRRCSEIYEGYQLVACENTKQAALSTEDRELCDRMW